MTRRSGIRKFEDFSDFSEGVIAEILGGIFSDEVIGNIPKLLGR